MDNQRLISLKQGLVRLELEEQALSKKTSSGRRNMLLGVLVPIFGFFLLIYADQNSSGDGLKILSLLMMCFILLIVIGAWQFFSSVFKLKAARSKIQDVKDEVILLEHS